MGKNFLDMIENSGLLTKIKELVKHENEIETLKKEIKESMKKDIYEAVKIISNPCTFNTIFMMFGKEVYDNNLLMKILIEIKDEINEEEHSIKITTAYNPNVECFKLFILKPQSPIKLMTLYNETIDPEETKYRLEPVSRVIDCSPMVAKIPLKND